MKLFTFLVTIILAGCQSAPSNLTYQSIETSIKQQYDNGRKDYLNVPTNQAGTIGKYWNWRAGYVAGTLSYNHFLIQGKDYKYHVEGLNIPNQPFQGIDSEVRYQSLPSIIQEVKKISKANFETPTDIDKRISQVQRQFPYGVFYVTAYGFTIESVSNESINIIIAQSGKKLASKKMTGIAETPGVTNMWYNNVVIPSPNFNGQPFVLRVNHIYSGRFTNYNFEPTIF